MHPGGLAAKPIVEGLIVPGLCSDLPRARHSSSRVAQVRYAGSSITTSKRSTLMILLRPTHPFGVLLPRAAAVPGITEPAADSAVRDKRGDDGGHPACDHADSRSEVGVGVEGVAGL